MATASLVIGIFALCGSLVAILPFLGWTNWIILPLALIGSSFGIISLKMDKSGSKTLAIIGLVLSLVALIVASVKLIVCGGIV